MSKDSIQQRMAAWMADYEESGLLRETMEPNEVDADLLNTAFDIMKECYPKFVTSVFIEEELGRQQRAEEDDLYWKDPHKENEEIENG